MRRYQAGQRVPRIKPPASISSFTIAVPTAAIRMAQPYQLVRKRDTIVHDFHAEFNARDYGAIGDGATDDTAAFQAVVDAATESQS